MDPVSGGALKQVQQNLFQEAEQSIQKANQQVSDFEKLRTKLEEQDAVSNPSQMEALDRMNQTRSADQVQQAEQIDPASQAKQIDGVDQVNEIKNMEELEGMVNNIRSGQQRLSEIISEATSGKTYSPSEMIAMQAEVGKITTELEMTTKAVEKFMDSVTQTLNMQL